MPEPGLSAAPVQSRCRHTTVASLCDRRADRETSPSRRWHTRPLASVQAALPKLKESSMRQHVTAWVAIALLGMATGALAQPGQNGFGDGKDNRRDKDQNESVQLGPRPFFLVNDMNDGPLKRELKGCSEGPFKKTDFSIGHRGAALQFPEHTRESYEAGARMGAGIVECDVTFTKDLQLVCRHAQNDLHTTTNILLTPLA